MGVASLKGGVSQGSESGRDWVIAGVGGFYNGAWPERTNRTPGGAGGCEIPRGGAWAYAEASGRDIYKPGVFGSIDWGAGSGLELAWGCRGLSLRFGEEIPRTRGQRR